MIGINFILIGLAAIAAGQIAAPIPINAHHAGYLHGGYGLGSPAAYPGVLGGYPSLGLNYGQNPYYGGYPYHHAALNYGRLPGQVPLNGALPLGLAGHHAAGLTGYGGLGLGVATHGGYPYHHGGLALNRGLTVNGGILPYNGLGANGLIPAAPRSVLTQNEVVISHGGIGASRQWTNRFDKN